MPFIGSSPNKQYRRTDGVRVGVETWQEADDASVPILSSAHDTHDQDLADAINALWLRDGGNQPTNDLSLNGFKFTGVGVGTAADHFISLDQNRKDSNIFGGVTTGNSGAFTVALSPVLTAYTDGMEIVARAHATNAVNATFNAGPGAKNVRVNGANVKAGSILSGTIFSLRYNSAADAFDLTGVDGAFAAATELGMSIINAANTSIARTSLGLGSAAIADLGTSGTNVPLLNGNNSWAGTATFTVASGIASKNTSKAFGRFSYNGTTLSLNTGSAFNITSVTRVSTGLYAVLFDTELVNGIYCVTVTAKEMDAQRGLVVFIRTQSSTGFEIMCRDATNTLQDANPCAFSVFSSS